MLLKGPPTSILGSPMGDTGAHAALETACSKADRRAHKARGQEACDRLTVTCWATIREAQGRTVVWLLPVKWTAKSPQLSDREGFVLGRCRDVRGWADTSARLRTKYESELLEFRPARVVS